MTRILMATEERVCDECSLALRRFLTGIEGVESIEVEDRCIVVEFDRERIDDGTLAKIARDNLEKLGHRLIE